MGTKTENIKFSIIIPVYNAEKYISECINSILTQTYSNLELIVIDDGSTDKSSEICDEFAIVDTRVKVHHKKNEGVSSARNDGLKYASGDYLMFVDADDIVCHNCLFTYYTCIQRYNGLLYFQNYTFIKETTPICIDKIEPYTCTCIEEFNFNDLFKKNWILFSATWSKCYKLSIIKDFNIRFNAELKMCEDFLFLSEYLLHVDRFYYISNIGYLYRVVNNSLSRNKINKDFSHIDMILNHNIFKSPSRFVLNGFKLYINMIINCDYIFLNRKTRYRLIKLYINYNVDLVGKKYFLANNIKWFPICIYDLYFLLAKRIS